MNQFPPSHFTELEYERLVTKPIKAVNRLNHLVLKHQTDLHKLDYRTRPVTEAIAHYPKVLVAPLQGEQFQTDELNMSFILGEKDVLQIVQVVPRLYTPLIVTQYAWHEMLHAVHQGLNGKARVQIAKPPGCEYEARKRFAELDLGNDYICCYTLCLLFALIKGGYNG